MAQFSKRSKNNILQDSLTLDLIYLIIFYNPNKQFQSNFKPVTLTLKFQNYF